MIKWFKDFFARRRAEKYKHLALEKHLRSYPSKKNNEAYYNRKSDEDYYRNHPTWIFDYDDWDMPSK